VNCAARENALGYNALRQKMRAINGGFLSVKGIYAFAPKIIIHLQGPA